MFKMNLTDNTTETPAEQMEVDLALQTAIELSRWLVPFIFGIIAFVGIIGNFLVIFTVCRQRAHRAVTYYYIVNLAVTDLAFLLCCVPFTATEYGLPSWIFGDLLCKFSGFMKQVTGLATCTTLTAMTIDRYRAIVHPFRSLQSRTARSAVTVSLAIWVVSSVYSLPYLIYKEELYHGNYSVTYCGVTWPNLFGFYYILGTFFVVYFIPLAIIGICYAILLRKLWGFSFNERESGEARVRMMQRKKHITLMILIVVLVFAGSWLPLHVVNLWNLLGTIPFNATTYYLRTFSLCLAFSNSCVNPIVYAFVGGKFRERFLYACPGFCRLKIIKQDTMHMGHIQGKGRSGSMLETTKRTKLLSSSDNTDGGKDIHCLN